VPGAAFVGPNGEALLYGFPTSSGYGRLVFRPLGGPSGSPHKLPSPMGYPGSTVAVAWFPDGSSLIADETADMVAFRPPGARATVGTPQDLSNGLGEGPAAMATGPNGVALIGLQGNLGVGAVYRSPGAKGVVDMKKAQYFGPGVLLGAALDPTKGGAVIVWRDSANSWLYEAVRNPGAKSFGKAQVLSSKPYGAAMAVNSAGYAVVTWMGGAAGPDSYPTQVFAAERSPGSAFAPANVIGDSPNGDPTYPQPGVTATGDGLVAWTSINSATSYDAKIAVSHGGSWSSPVDDGVTQIGMGHVASAGKTILIALGPDAANAYDTQTATSSKGGLSLAHAVAVSGPPVAMGVGDSDSAAYVDQQVTHGKPVGVLLPYEDRTRTTDVTVRMEGANRTLLKSTVVTLHLGWVTKFGAPVGSCSNTGTAGALDVAANHKWAGTFSAKVDSYTVSSILGETEKAPVVWNTWVNDQRSNGDICALDLRTGDQVLFAAAKPTADPIGLVAPSSGTREKAFHVNLVSFGSTGVSKPLAGARVSFAGGSVVSNHSGVATILPTRVGTLVLTASDQGYIRASSVQVKVTQ
jgi:hypothetical protein